VEYDVAKVLYRGFGMLASRISAVLAACEVTKVGLGIEVDPDPDPGPWP